MEFLIGLLALSIYVLVRNKLVFRFRRDLLSQVAAGAKKDIHRGGVDWHARYDLLDEVGYSEMLYKFWKPLNPKSWWEDTSFLEMSGDA